jgi:hypothetical protein
MTPLEQLKNAGLVDPEVLAVGLERGWITRDQVIEYAVERLGGGDGRTEVLKLAAAEDLETQTIVTLLRRWAELDRLPTGSLKVGLRKWMFASLKSIEESPASPEEKLDRVEEIYALLGYPEQMNECSRYYIPAADRARGIQVGEVTASPLEAVHRLVALLQQELGSEVNHAALNVESAAKATRS